MIPTLYKCFQHWSEQGSVWLISDTHFEDSDCKLMHSEWITPEEHIKKINEKVQKNDYLIHLGDIGNPEWLRQLKCRNRVLILGNHDQSATKFEPYFKEIYTGPLFIAEKILLSHEPIKGLENICLNIHGHDHGGTFKRFENENRLNIASNIYGINYSPISLKDIIKSGYLSKVKGIHRDTIDYQTEHSLKKQELQVRIIDFSETIESDEIGMFIPCSSKCLAIKKPSEYKTGKCPICNAGIYIEANGLACGHN